MCLTKDESGQSSLAPPSSPSARVGAITKRRLIREGGRERIKRVS